MENDAGGLWVLCCSPMDGDCGGTVAADVGDVALLLFHLFASESSVLRGPPRCKSELLLGEDVPCYERRVARRDPWRH